MEKLLSNAVDSFFDGWEDGSFCVYGAIVCGTAYSIAVSGGGENGPSKVSYVKAFVSPIQ